MPGTYDLVGEKIREIFDAQAVMIGTFDHDRAFNRIDCIWKKGQRFHSAPTPHNAFLRHFIESRRTHLDNHVTPKTVSKWGTQVADGTECPKSVVFVPMLSGDAVRGFLGIQDIDRFDAFHRAAHSLKSNSNTFGALALGALARELELKGLEHARRVDADALEALAREYARVAAALTGLRDA